MTRTNEDTLTKASLICDTKDLFQTLKFLKAALPKSKKNKQYNCEITLKTNEAVFIVIGAKRSLYCKTNGVVKVTMPLLHLYNIVRDMKEYNTHITIGDGYMTINDIAIHVWTFFFEDDTILRSVNLPINFSASDIIHLPEIYTQEEMNFNNLTPLHQKAYKTLSNDIKQVYKYLKKYGFTLFDIEKIIHDKVYNKKRKANES
jgi:hypothetical protein